MLCLCCALPQATQSTARSIALQGVPCGAGMSARLTTSRLHSMYTCSLLYNTVSGQEQKHSQKNNGKARIDKDTVLQGSAKLQELVNSGVNTTAEYAQSNSTILHAVQLSLENPLGGNVLPQKMTMERLAQELELHLAGTHERQLPTTVRYLYTCWRSPPAMLMPYGIGYGPQGIHGYQAVDPWLGLSHQANQCHSMQHADLQLLSACRIPCTDSRLDSHAYLMQVTCIPDCCVCCSKSVYMLWQVACTSIFCYSWQ